MKRLLVGGVALVAAVAGGVIGREAVRAVLGGDPDPRSVAYLTRVASELNKNAPMMVDAETEWTNTGAAEGAIIYNYRLVNFDHTMIAASDLEAELMPGVVNAACTNPQTRRPFLDKGIAMRYAYYDRDRRLIGSFEVTAAKCES